jgi:transposase
MMYGFGDDPAPRADSVDLVEDMVVEYLTDIVLGSSLTTSNPAY